ncbi:MAG: hypothetical protein ACRYG5_06675 [Janthinobacterium lividum]
MTTPQFPVLDATAVALLTEIEAALATPVAPGGSATAALQTAGNASLTAIAAAIAARLSVYTANVVETAALSTADFSATGLLAIPTSGLSSVGIALTGTPVGATAVFEATIDNANWFGVSAEPDGAGGGGKVASATAAGVFNVNCGSWQQFRVRLSGITSGSFAVTLVGTAGLKHVRTTNGIASDLQATAKSAPLVAMTDRSGVIPGGVTGTGSITPGSGGTNGTFALAFTGGTAPGGGAVTVPATGTFTVSSGGVSSIAITSPGLYATAPTLSFAASAGLTGAAAPAVLGGLAVTIMAANASRLLARVQNTGTGDLWFNDTGGAASVGGLGCYRLSAAQSYESPIGGASPASWSLYGATAGQTFSALEGQ